MSIYVIADLHLALNNSKPMDIFGANWKEHHLKIKKYWENKVKNEDTVLILGDFSWETYLENTYKDFEFLNSLPGKKILLKGNHDYWWTTVTNIRKYLKQNNFNTIDILFNNAYEIEDYIIAGVRGWDYSKCEDDQIIQREINRLKISLKEAQNKNKEISIIVGMHYPPISANYMQNIYENKIIRLLKEYNVKKCFYGHLHGISQNNAIQGEIEGIDFNLVSADYLNFDLLKIK